MKALNTSPLNPLKTKSCQTSYSLTVRESFFFSFFSFYLFSKFLVCSSFSANLSSMPEHYLALLSSISFLVILSKCYLFCINILYCKLS